MKIWKIDEDVQTEEEENKKTKKASLKRKSRVEKRVIEVCFPFLPSFLFFCFIFIFQNAFFLNKRSHWYLLKGTPKAFPRFIGQKVILKTYLQEVGITHLNFGMPQLLSAQLIWFILSLFIFFFFFFENIIFFFLFFLTFFFFSFFFFFFFS